MKTSLLTIALTTLLYMQTESHPKPCRVNCKINNDIHPIAPWYVRIEICKNSTTFIQHPLINDHIIRKSKKLEVYEPRMTYRFINASQECLQTLAVHLTPQETKPNITNEQWENASAVIELALLKNNLTKSNVACKNAELEVVNSVYFKRNPDNCQRHFVDEEAFSCNLNGFTSCLPNSILCRQQNLCNSSYTTVCTNTTIHDFVYQIAARNYPRFLVANVRGARAMVTIIYLVIPVSAVVLSVLLCIYCGIKNSWRWTSKMRVAAYYNKESNSTSFLSKQTSEGSKLHWPTLSSTRLMAASRGYTPINSDYDELSNQPERQLLNDNLHDYYKSSK